MYRSTKILSSDLNVDSHKCLGTNSRIDGYIVGLNAQKIDSFWVFSMQAKVSWIVASGNFRWFDVPNGTKVLLISRSSFQANILFPRNVVVSDAFQSIPNKQVTIISFCSHHKRRNYFSIPSKPIIPLNLRVYKKRSGQVTK